MAESKKNTGKQHGLNVRQTWMKLFVQNERAAKSAKMTDEQIQAEMRKEFPGRESFEFTDIAGVASVRRGYNRGVFTEGKAPDIQSKRYDKDGNELTARGKVVGGAAPAPTATAKGKGKGKGGKAKAGKKA